MTTTAERLEHALATDLAQLRDRFVDEEFCGDLYRALAGNAWTKEGEDGRVAFSWSRAEEVVNEQRARIGHDPLPVVQTGGEGEVTDLVRNELGRVGWHPEVREPSDPDHLSRPESPPPPGQGERMAPAPPSDWEQRAHEDAERERLR
jgi:hypothetical protein